MRQNALHQTADANRGKVSRNQRGGVSPPTAGEDSGPASGQQAAEMVGGWGTEAREAFEKKMGAGVDAVEGAPVRRA